jgi:hypothetical protein
MKLRLLDSSVTLRLQPEEIHVLADQGIVTQVTRIGDATIKIELILGEIEEVSLSYSTSSFSFGFPKAELEHWLTTEKVGYSAMQNQLKVTIEKDLPRRKKHLMNP